MKALRRLTATLALAALSVLPAAAAQAHAADPDHDTQPVSRPADQTPAQRTLARVLAREHYASSAPSDPQTHAAQQALTRVLAREHNTYPAPADGQQATNEQQAGPSRTFPLLPLLIAVGLTVLLATAATWRRLRARARPREAT